VGIPTKENLLRTIGVFGLTSNIVNVIIGSGIFVLPAIVAAGMGASGVLAYIFCGILIAFIMLCFAEVGSKITITGGVYTYIETVFGKYAGFLAGNLFLASVITADAAVSNALVNILAAGSSIFNIPMVRVALLFTLFFGLALINILGVKQGLGLVKFFVIAKILPLLLLVLFGLPKVSLNNLNFEALPTIDQLGSTSLILFFAFIGGESALNVGGEVKNPQKNIPKSIFLGIVTVLMLYILIQMVSQGVLGNALKDQKAPLAETARQIFGHKGFMLLTAGAAISMIGYMSGTILNMPRVLYALSRDRVIPVKIFGKIHPKLKTPIWAILSYAAAGFTLASLGSFNKLAIIATSAILLLYLGVVIAVIKLRYTQKINSGGFIIPGGLLVPFLSVVIIISFLLKLTFEEIIGTVIFLVILTVIFVINNYFKK
jgi:amino acid transporter